MKDPIEKDIENYIRFVYSLLEDPVEEHILDYISELQEQISVPKRVLKKERIDGKAAQQVFGHFLNLYRKKYGKDYEVVSNKIGIYTRISNFMATQKLSVDSYCNFLDYAFKHLFNYQYIPGIGHICSNKVFETCKNATKKKEKPDFNQLRKQIKRDTFL